jgi:uncharacterized membrane protein YoaK (UPF0700 family)
VRTALLLAFGAGATDALGILALGRVFTSVMTGNLVLLGIAAGTGTAAALVRVSVALAGYLLAVAGAAWYLRSGAPRAVLAAEAVAQAGLLAGWLATGTRPSLVPELVLAAVAAVAMGAQAQTVRTLALPVPSTTYLTGTLTSLAASLATGVRDGKAGRLAAVVGAVLAGAAACAAALDFVRPLAAALPLLATTVALVTWFPPARARRRGPVG